MCVIPFDIVVRAEKAELTGVESGIVFGKLTVGTRFALKVSARLISDRIPWSISWRPPHPPAGVASSPVPDEIVDTEHFLFLPALSRLAFAFGNTFQVRGDT